MPLTLVRQRRSHISGGRTGTRENIISEEDFIWYPANVYTWFIWLKSFANIENLLIPYRTAKFTKTWEYLMTDGQAAKTIAKLDESLNLVKAWKVGFEKYMEFMRARVCRDLKDLLHRYQEGALVMLTLADCAGKGGWRFRQDRDVSLSEFPGIEGKDPVEVWCLVENLRGLMRGALGEKTFTSIFIKYFDEYVGYSYDEFDERLNWAGFQTPIFRYPPYEELVGALVSLSRDTKARAIEAEEKEEAARERERIEKECAEKVGTYPTARPQSLSRGGCRAVKFRR